MDFRKQKILGSFLAVANDARDLCIENNKNLFEHQDAVNTVLSDLFGRLIAQSYKENWYNGWRNGIRYHFFVFGDDTYGSYTYGSGDLTYGATIETLLANLGIESAQYMPG